MIHEDGALGATYFAGCAWNRFQTNGGCKWSRSEVPRRFEPYEDPDDPKAQHVPHLPPTA